MQWPAFLAARAAERASGSPAPVAGGRAAAKPLRQTLAAPKPPRRVRGSPDIRRARRGAQAQGRARRLAAGATAGDASAASSSAEGGATHGPNGEPLRGNGVWLPARQRASELGGGLGNPGARGGGAGGASRRRRTWELPNPKPSLAQPPRALAACGDGGSERERIPDGSEAGLDSRGASESGGGTGGAYTDDADSAGGSARSGAESKARSDTSYHLDQISNMLAQSSMRALSAAQAVQHLQIDELPLPLHTAERQKAPYSLAQLHGLHMSSVCIIYIDIEVWQTAAARRTGWRTSRRR